MRGRRTEPRLGFVRDKPEPAERTYSLGEVASRTRQFGGNREASVVLQAVAGVHAAQLRFALRSVAVAELLPGLLDTDPAQVADLAALRVTGVGLDPVVVAGALLVDGNHRVAASASVGEAEVAAFVLLEL